MNDIEKYELTLSMHEQARRKLNGLIAAHYQKPLGPFTRLRARQNIESHAQRWGEPILLVTGDIEQLYFSVGKKPTEEAGWDSLCGEGFWGLAISRGLGKVLNKDDVRRSAFSSSEEPDQIPLLVFEVPYQGDALLVQQRYQDLMRRNIPLLLDPRLREKTLVSGKLAESVTGLSAAQDLAIG